MSDSISQRLQNGQGVSEFLKKSVREEPSFNDLIICQLQCEQKNTGASMPATGGVFQKDHWSQYVTMWGGADQI